CRTRLIRHICSIQKETREQGVLREIKEGSIRRKANQRERSLLMAIVPQKRSEERALAERTSDPFGYLRNQINRVFDDFWGESWLAPRESFAGFWPQVDVTETDKEVKVCAEIPGVDAKDIEVSVEDGTLTIKGEKKYEQEEKQKGQYRMERSYGSF